MLEVPYHRQQRDYSCGTACLKMVLNYWGIEISEDELIELCGATELGVTRFELMEAALEFDVQADAFLGIVPTEVERGIKDGMPIIALIDPSKIYGGVSAVGHFVVIVNWDTDVVVYHDPIMGANLTTDRKTFDQAWQEFDYRGVRIWKPTRR